MKVSSAYMLILPLIFGLASTATGNGLAANEFEMINSLSSHAAHAGHARNKIDDKSPVYFKVLQTCEKNKAPNLNTYERLDYTLYLDSPDPIISRATSAIEETLTVKLAREKIQKPLTKVYCQIGVSRIVVDYTHAVDDDSVSHQSLRAIYAWVVVGEVAGWQISKLGRLDICARQRNPKSGQCL